MFQLMWLPRSAGTYEELRSAAEAARAGRDRAGRATSSKAEGLFKHVHKCIMLLSENPKHPGLNTHEYSSLTNPFDPAAKVFEACAQNDTLGAYRVFWCYGPKKQQITIIAITPHP
jgi:hypothetical protein